MSLFDRKEKTICGLATGVGRGAIAVIRISGREALRISRQLCHFLPDNPESHRVYYGFAKNLDNESLDEVLLTYFAEGKSFTGEECIEVSCHGGEAVVNQLLQSLIGYGAVMAERGEFSFRAFLNGRIDLVQAESIQSLVGSRSKQAAKLALRQLKGEVSGELNFIEQQLTWLLAHLEANIDFATEDIEVATQSLLLEKANEVQLKLDNLVDGYNSGRVLESGLAVALAGPPNVGKSSLLNRIVGDDRALVTEIPGTTRDIIEAEIQRLGIQVKFIDTAGVRLTLDQVERLGIAKAQATSRNADIQVIVLDLSQRGLGVDWDKLPLVKPETTLVLGNKMDLVIGDLDIRQSILGSVQKEVSGEELDFWKSIPESNFVAVSAHTGQGCDVFLNLVDDFLRNHFCEDAPVISHQRHFEGLVASRRHLQAGIGHLVNLESPEFIAVELRDALRCVYSVMGKEYDEQVIDKIFQEFCLGK